MDRLRAWSGPDKTALAECGIDARLGGGLYIVTVASEAMGKYAGTRWPMEGTFTGSDEQQRLPYHAQSWTERPETTETIHHNNDLTVSEGAEKTSLTLHVAITDIGPGLKAKLAVLRTEWGCKSQLNALEKHRAG